MKKIISILVCALLMVSMLAGCGKKSQFDGLASKMQAIKSGDFSKLQDMAPEAYWELREDNDDEFDIKDLIDEKTENFEDETADEREDVYGKNWKVSVSVDDEQKLDKDEVADIAEALDESFKIDEDEVTDAYYVWLYTNIEGDEDRSHGIAKYTAVKISGKWYLCSSYEYDNTLRVYFAGI